MPNNLSGNGGFSTSDLREALGYLKDIRDAQEQINAINVSPKADDSDIKKLNKQISELKQNIENQPKTTSQLFDTKIIQNNINKAQSQLDKFYDKIKSKEQDLTPLQTKSFLQNYKTLEKYTEHFGEDLISKYKSIYDEMMASYSKNADLPSYRTSSVSKDLIKNVQVTKSEFKSMLDEIQIETENLFNQDLFDANKQATASLYKEQRNALLAQKQAIQDNVEAVSNAEREKREQILATRDAMAKNIESIVNEKLSGVNENQYIKIDDKSWGEVQQKFYDMTQFLSNLGLEVEDIEKSFAKLQNATYVDSSKIEEAKNKLQQMASTSQTAAEGVNKVSDSVNNVAGSNQDGVTTGIGKIAKETEQASQDMQAYGSISTEAFDSSKLGAYVSLLEEVRNILNDISTTLGSVDRSSGFGNLISNVDVLLEKLDTVSKTIGNAQYGAEANSVLKATRNRYGTAYEKITSKAGGEEKLFAYINNVLDIKGGIDELYNSFSSTSVSNIDSIEMQIYRMMDFFKLLRQAMSTGEFGLDLSGIQIPAGNDKALQKRIKEASTKGVKEGQIINVESDKDSLIAITDKLIEIKNLLSEISQKNLFGDSLNVFSSKLDEIVGKFEILVADVKVINETPIQATDAGTGTKLDELKERIDVGKETQEQIKTTEEEISKSKQFIENAYKETAQKLAQFFNVPKNAYEELFQLVSSTHIDVKNIDKVIDFLQSKSQSLTEQTDPIWTQVRDYVSKSKIKLSQGDVSEFGDDFNTIRGVIGVSTLNKTTGSDALTFLNELNSLFGNIIPEANTTQDAIRNLYEYLSKPIKIPIEPFSERDFVDTTYWEIEQARDKIKEQYDKSNQKIFNNTNSNNIQEATDAIEAEGNAAETAATKKEKFAQANEKVAQSGKTTATSTTAATNAVKAEGDAAEKAANQFNTASDAVEGYIRKQRGKADSGNYNYTQAINKVVDKQVTKTTDSEGNVATIETLLVNYDKLSKELVKTDTEIFNLQQQIKNTTQGNTQGLQNNLDILKDQRKTYEELLDLMIQEDKYAITDTQKTVLDGQRAKNLEWLQNIQDTKDSINQLKQNSQTVSLGLKVEVKSRELEDYVAKLKELNVFTPKVEQETLNLSRSLSQVTSGKGLADWTNEFKILKSDMSSVVSGSQDNIKTIANQQVSAYKNIWSIRKQIAKLDTTADANLISELQAQEQEQKNIYITKTQELKAINQQVAREQVLNNIVNIRRQAEDEIKNIKAKQSDAEVINNYNTIIAKYREIKQLNRDIQSLITAGVSSNELVITGRQDKINALKTEISLIDQTKFSTEQLTEINNAYAESEQVVADAAEKRKAKGTQEQQQIDKTRNSLLQQASALTTNGKLMRKYGDDVNSYIKELQNTGTTKERLEEIRIALMNIKTEANLAGQSGKTFMQILKSRFASLGAYISTFTSFYRIISYVRQAFTTLTDLDTQLVDLRKTTSMTTNELNEFYSASSDVAKQLGVTTSEIISQAAAWSRFNKIDPLYGNI